MRVPDGTGSGSKIPLSLKDPPRSVETDQPTWLKLPLGLGLGGNIVRRKLPESLNPTIAFSPHQATLSSLVVLPARWEMKSSDSKGLFASLAASRAPIRRSALSPNKTNSAPPLDSAFTESGPRLSLMVLA